MLLLAAAASYLLLLYVAAPSAAVYVRFRQLTGGKISWPVSDVRSLHPSLLRLIESKAKRRGDHQVSFTLLVHLAVHPNISSSSSSSNCCCCCCSH